MTKFRKLPTASSCPDVDWYEDLPLPEGRTFVCTGRQQIQIDQIKRTNTEGQIANIARQVGTIKENVQELENSIKLNGVLLDAQPPFVGDNMQLQDGWSRLDAILRLGVEYWVFNIVQPKKGFTWRDVSDEIGLGANDHPPSRAATRGDFTTRLASWVAIQEKEPTQGQCVDWVNNIPHSFPQKIVTNIAEQVLRGERASKTVESFETKDVIKRVHEEINTLTESVDIIPFNMSGNSTYFTRATFEVLRSISNKNKDARVSVGYTKGIPANEIDAVREAGLKNVQRINDMFEAAFQLRSDKGKEFKLLDIDYMMPQVIDVETSLIPVEKTE